MENEELIRLKMEHTRESLTSKLESLEDKVTSSMEKATTAVTDTVASVKETMHEGVESVKSAVDVPAHVDKHPWLMMGGAVLGGFMLGSLLFRSDRQSASRHEEKPIAPPRTPRMHGNGHHAAADNKPAEPAAAESGLLSMMGPEIDKLKALAIGVALGTMREAVISEAPPHLAEQIGGIIDAITEKIGGNPVPSADLPFAKSEAPAGNRGPAPSSFQEQPRW